jgi:hypothetical protein
MLFLFTVTWTLRSRVSYSLNSNFIIGEWLQGSPCKQMVQVHSEIKVCDAFDWWGWS